MGNKRRRDEDPQSRHAAPPDLLTQHEQDRLLVATARALSSNAPTEMQLKAVIGFARRARASEVMLNDVLIGDLIPAGVKDGEIGFRTLDKTVNSEVGDGLRGALSEVTLAVKPAIPIEAVISGTCDVDKVLSDSEIGRLRIVHDWVTTHCSLQEASVTSFLEWAADCRRENALLNALLDGIILPFPREHGTVEFLLSRECMNEIELKRYRKALRRCPGR